MPKPPLPSTRRILNSERLLPASSASGAASDGEARVAGNSAETGGTGIVTARAADQVIPALRDETTNNIDERIQLDGTSALRQCLTAS